MSTKTIIIKITLPQIITDNRIYTTNHIHDRDSIFLLETIATVNYHRFITKANGATSKLPPVFTLAVLSSAAALKYMTRAASPP